MYINVYFFIAAKLVGDLIRHVVQASSTKIAFAYTQFI